MDEILAKGSPFIGKQVQLRAVEKTDLDDIMKHWNTFESRIGLGTIIPMSSMMEEDWIKSTHERAKNQTGFMFVIEHKETKELLGTCGCEDMNWIAKSGIIGIGIHNPENHNKGYGTDAMNCLLRFGFDVLNLNRIELWVMEYNERAIHVYEKLGFKKVGKKRQAHFVQGSYHDIIEMDILCTEFKR
ncbi:MAG: GNAT family N-acetyltransferase [Candidatus Heimdallarchaeota archaeon]|nr:GNAT family N-acetyltransferase [Candidatus Heimdallarchaeota archaeon]MCK4877850.1 GNAT family N-acetyltransferase [Candidatus Heimdallarchaeota archaeon]